MAQCIGNCALCELDVDKQTCCTFQLMKQILLLRKAVSSLAGQVAELHPAVQRTVDDIQNAEPDAFGAATEETVEGTIQ